MSVRPFVFGEELGGLGDPEAPNGGALGDPAGFVEEVERTPVGSVGRVLGDARGSPAIARVGAGVGRVTGQVERSIQSSRVVSGSVAPATGRVPTEGVAPAEGFVDRAVGRVFQEGEGGAAGFVGLVTARVPVEGEVQATAHVGLVAGLVEIAREESREATGSIGRIVAGFLREAITSTAGSVSKATGAVERDRRVFEFGETGGQFGDDAIETGGVFGDPAAYPLRERRTVASHAGAFIGDPVALAETRTGGFTGGLAGAAAPRVAVIAKGILQEVLGRAPADAEAWGSGQIPGIVGSARPSVAVLGRGVASRLVGASRVPEVVSAARSHAGRLTARISLAGDTAVRAFAVRVVGSADRIALAFRDVIGRARRATARVSLSGVAPAVAHVGKVAARVASAAASRTRGLVLRLSGRTSRDRRVFRFGETGGNLGDDAVEPGGVLGDPLAYPAIERRTIKSRAVSFVGVSSPLVETRTDGFVRRSVGVAFPSVAAVAKGLLRRFTERIPTEVEARGVGFLRRAVGFPRPNVRVKTSGAVARALGVARAPEVIAIARAHAKRALAGIVLMGRTSTQAVSRRVRGSADRSALAFFDIGGRVRSVQARISKSAFVRAIGDAGRAVARVAAEVQTKVRAFSFPSIGKTFRDRRVFVFGELGGHLGDDAIETGGVLGDPLAFPQVAPRSVRGFVRRIVGRARSFVSVPARGFSGRVADRVATEGEAHGVAEVRRVVGTVPVDVDTSVKGEAGDFAGHVAPGVLSVAKGFARGVVARVPVSAIAIALARARRVVTDSFREGEGLRVLPGQVVRFVGRALPRVAVFPRAVVRGVEARLPLEAVSMAVAGSGRVLGAMVLDGATAARAQVGRLMARVRLPSAVVVLRGLTGRVVGRVPVLAGVRTASHTGTIRGAVVAIGEGFRIIVGWTRVTAAHVVPHARALAVSSVRQVQGVIVLARERLVFVEARAGRVVGKAFLFALRLPRAFVRAVSVRVPAAAESSSEAHVGGLMAAAVPVVRVLVEATTKRVRGVVAPVAQGLRTITGEARGVFSRTIPRARVLVQATIGTVGSVAVGSAVTARVVVARAGRTIGTVLVLARVLPVAVARRVVTRAFPSVAVAVRGFARQVGGRALPLVEVFALATVRRVHGALQATALGTRLVLTTIRNVAGRPVPSVLVGVAGLVKSVRGRASPRIQVVAAATVRRARGLADRIAVGFLVVRGVVRRIIGQRRRRANKGARARRRNRGPRAFRRS